MDALKAVAAIREKFRETGGKADVPLLRGRAFTAELAEGGVSVDNLGNQPFLPWAVFEETVRLLERRGGRARRGNAMDYRLGDPGLPLDCVEGHIAHVIYGKRRGDSVFRRITPIACILIWAGVCEHARGELVLARSYCPEAASPTEDMAALGFWNRASDFLHSGDAVMQTPDVGGEYIACYLYAHGLELAFKAYMRAREVGVEKLRKKYGHKLEKLLSGADKLGLEAHVSLTAEHRAVIAQVADAYAEKCFEYPKPGILTLPHAHRLREVLALLLPSIKRMVLTATKEQTGG